MLIDRFISIFRGKQVLAPGTALTTDTVSKAVDRSSASDGTNKVGGLGAKSIAFEFNVANAGDTWSATDRIGLRLQESADSTDGNDGTWTEVDAADLVYDHSIHTLVGNQIHLISSSASDLSVYYLGYRGSGKMVRASLDFNGTHSTGTLIAITAIMEMQHGPAGGDAV